MVYEGVKKDIKENLSQWGKECVSLGKDKYVVLTYKKDLILKNYLDISEHDIIFGKIVLLWKDSSLIYKYIEFEPYKKIKKNLGLVKFKNKNGENEKYRILFLPERKNYVIENPNSKKMFKNIKDAKDFILKYKHYEKFDRDYIYGIS